MTTLKWISMALALLLITGCGAKRTEQAIEAKAGAVEEAVADQIINATLKEMEKREAAKFPCSAFTQAEIENLVGNPLLGGMHASVHHTENDAAFRTNSCDWSNREEGDGSVRLWVARPEGFPSRRAECLPLGGAGTKHVSGVGSSATWQFMKSFGYGTLRVCDSKAMIEVVVRKKGATDEAQQQLAGKVAEQVLSKL